MKSPNYTKLFRNGVVAFFAIVLSTSAVFSQGFKVSGNRLLDANGNNFIMKGVNVPLSWFVSDVNNNIANIRNRTNSNCMRIVVNTSTPDNAWQTCVNNCIANKVVPMVELHDVTGSNSTADLQRMANFWASKASFLRSSNVAKYILINIANEWGDWFMSSPTNDPSGTVWRDAYINAIRTLRNAGINTTIVVDAPGYGQDNKANTLLTYGAAVQSGDPQHNVLFSVHMYCEWAVNGNSTVTSHLPQIRNSGLPIIVGEFGYQHTEGSSICDINESQIISTCQSNGIGWLAWSWKGNGGDVAYLDLSYDWGGTSLSGWGNTVVNGSNGTKTAVTCSAFNSTGCGTASNGFPICCNASSDPDGDGWGWENNATCYVQNSGSISNGTYRIIARHSGKSLDVSGSSTADGANVTQYTYNGANNQKWIVQSVGGGAYSIRALHSGKGLDVGNASTANGADINQWTYNGGNNQKWRIESVGSGYYRIVSVNSGKCVDVVGNSTADGAQINQYTCSGTNNQSFTMQFLSSATSRIAEEEESVSSLNIYPNPSASSFTIEEAGKFTYSVKDNLGKVKEHGKGENKVTFGQNLSSGMYFIQINSIRGNKLVKILKN